MMFRSMMMGAALLFAVGCRVQSKPDAGCVGITCPTGGGIGAGGGSGGGSAGGGGGSMGGGSGGGSTGGSGGGSTGGGAGGGMGMPTTVQAAKASTYPAKVALRGVVVTAISFARRSAAAACAGASSAGVTADFWVADPASAEHGVWVQKFRCDGDVDYFPAVGDVLNVSGVIGFETPFKQRVASRIMVKSEFDFIPGKPMGYVCAVTSTPPCEPFAVTKTGTMSPLPVVNQLATFGAAGFRAEQALKGARITIAGPLTVASITPAALHQVSAQGANDPRYFGFALSNGVLVNDFRIFGGAQLEDGGVSRCDVRAMVADGGTVTFPNGITGVWDTYAFAPCLDGGTDIFRCFAGRGTVPPSPDSGYTNVLYPTDCADLNQ